MRLCDYWACWQWISENLDGTQFKCFFTEILWLLGFRELIIIQF